MADCMSMYLSHNGAQLLHGRLLIRIHLSSAVCSALAKAQNKYEVDRQLPKWYVYSWPASLVGR